MIAYKGKVKSNDSIFINYQFFLTLVLFLALQLFSINSHANPSAPSQVLTAINQLKNDTKNEALPYRYTHFAGSVLSRSKRAVYGGAQARGAGYEYHAIRYFRFSQRLLRLYKKTIHYAKVTGYLSPDAANSLITQATNITHQIASLIDNKPSENRPPISVAGTDLRVRVGDSVNLDGSNSSDQDGDPLTYMWELISNPSGSAAQLSDSTEVMPTFVADVAGSYTFQLVVNDGTVDSQPDEVVIYAGNSIPVADAGVDQTVVSGETVILDGSGSTDRDSDPLTYLWTIVSKPLNSAAELANPTDVMPTFVVDVSGTYTIGLSVNDGSEESLPDEVVISTENSKPVANAGGDQTATLGSTVTLDGSGSTDMDGDTLTYSWVIVERPNGSTTELSNTSEVMPTFIPDVAGIYSVQLIVSDEIESSDADVVTITTDDIAINLKPVARAGNSQSVNVMDLVELDGSASSDPEDQPLTYRWTLISTPDMSNAQLDDSTSVMPTFVADAQGNYIVQLIVNDSTQDSEPATVDIAAGAYVQPIAIAGEGQSIPIGATVLLDGSNSTDPDFDPLTYTWSLISQPLGSTATISDPQEINPTFVADLPGDYIAQLIVNDGTENSIPDTVTIVTGNPVAVINAPGIAQIGSSVALDADGSGDPDGNPISFFLGNTIKTRG